MKQKIIYSIVTLICLFSFCYTAKAENTSNWDGMCEYSKTKIYFNQKELKCGDDPDGLFDTRYTCIFEIEEFLAVNDGFCPTRLYESCFGVSCSFALSKRFLFQEVTLKSEEYYNGYGKTERPPASDHEPINGCEDLFGEELLKKINKYLNIIKIAIPIILIGYGILDFSKAMFSGTDDMKKAQKNFLLRIVAAILFFLVPIFVNLVLTLGNKVWSTINPDICIK